MITLILAFPGKEFKAKGKDADSCLTKILAELKGTKFARLPRATLTAENGDKTYRFFVFPRRFFVNKAYPMVVAKRVDFIAK